MQTAKDVGLISSIHRFKPKWWDESLVGPDRDDFAGPSDWNMFGESVESDSRVSGLKWIVKPDSVVTHNGVTAIIHLAP